MDPASENYDRPPGNRRQAAREALRRRRQKPRGAPTQTGGRPQAQEPPTDMTQYLRFINRPSQRNLPFETGRQNYTEFVNRPERFRGNQRGRDFLALQKKKQPMTGSFKADSPPALGTSTGAASGGAGVPPGTAPGAGQRKSGSAPGRNLEQIKRKLRQVGQLKHSGPYPGQRNPRPFK